MALAKYGSQGKSVSVYSYLRMSSFENISTSCYNRNLHSKNIELELDNINTRLGAIRFFLLICQLSTLSISFISVRNDNQPCLAMMLL